MTDTPCATCGLPHLLCSKHRQTDGKPCQSNKIVPGLNVCYKHAGMTKDEAREKGRLNLVRADAERALRDEGYEPITDPVAELLDLTARMRTFMDHMLAKVAELGEWRYESKAGGEQLRAEVALYERAADRTGRLLEKCIALGLYERQVTNQERYVDGLIDVMERALVELGFDAGQRGQVRDTVLRLVRAA